VPVAVPSNRLLELLDAEVRAALPLTEVSLQARQVLYEPGTPALHAYFPIDAVISLISTMADGSSTEVALIGRDGMVGLVGVLGSRQGTTAAVVQVAGQALRIPTGVLRRERLRSASLRTVLDLYTEAHLIQVAQTAACNRLHSVEARLARWLLAIAERVDVEYFLLPQEFMAQMLGVHRPTVSVALHALRDAGVVTYRGRSLKVADPAGLETIACECHGVLRREFDRLFRRPRVALDALPLASERPAATRSDSAAAVETMREVSGRLLLATIREQEARDEAEAANRAKDQFLAMVSHELRTPLNAIVGWASILADRPGASTERGLNVIRRNAAALVKLVEDLLDAARLTADTLVLHPSTSNLAEIVSSAVDTVRPDADRKGVRLRTALADDVPSIEGDPDRLRQVFLNVLANALKFTEAGGVIDVRVRAIGQVARVSIQDSGAGIDPDELPHVFERFHQGAGASSEQGLGLGLSIARVLIERHHGTIRLASPGTGQGATCTIELPMTAPASAAARVRAMHAKS
jgi:signal transduction histidine kinase